MINKVNCVESSGRFKVYGRSIVKCNVFCAHSNYDNSALVSFYLLKKDGILFGKCGTVLILFD